jgi:hypothetical protein
MNHTIPTVQFCQLKTVDNVKTKYMCYVENDGYKEGFFELKPSDGCKKIVDQIANLIGDFSKDKRKSQELLDTFKTSLEKGEIETLVVQSGGQIESEKEIYKSLTRYIKDCIENSHCKTDLQMGIHKDGESIYIASDLLSPVLQEITGKSQVEEVKKKLKDFLELNDLFRGNTGRRDYVVNTPQKEKKCYRAWRFIPYEEKQTKPQREPLWKNASTETTDNERKGA